MDYKKEIIKILEDEAVLLDEGYGTTGITEDEHEKIADRIVKLFAIHDIISRLDKQNEALEQLYENMSNQNIVEPLKELLNRDGYKAGFMDGFRTAIDYIKNGL